MINKKDRIFIALLSFIAVITHLNWFNPDSAINFSDWLYFPDQAVSELWFTWGTWISMWNLGTPNIQTSFYPFKLIWSLIANLGFSYDTATKITFFIPIALFGFLSPYILAKKLFSDHRIAFVTALFYGSTTYFLIKQIAHIPIAFVYAFMPIVFYFFIYALQSKKMWYWLIFSLLLSLITWYEIRITLLVIGILLLYFVLFHLKEIKIQYRNLAIFGLTFTALNTFWIIPIAFTSVHSSISAVISRGVFGDFLFDIQHAFTIVDASWTGGLPNREFIKQPVQWFYWFIPIIAFLPTLVIKKVPLPEKKHILFFTVVALTGILLTKQSTAPFDWLYSSLYNHVPIFQLYREASKFYLLTAFGYFGLLGFSIKYIHHILKTVRTNITHAPVLISTIIIGISLINLYPLVTQKMQTTFVSSEVPDEFQELNNVILSDTDFYRTVWLETCCQYMAFNTKHPRVVGLDYVTQINTLLNIQDYGKNIHDKYIAFFDHPSSKKILHETSVKYVAIPIGTSNSVDPQVNRRVAKVLQEKDFLSVSQLSNEKLIIFETRTHAKHLYLSSSPIYTIETEAYSDFEYKAVSPTQYEIQINNVSDTVYIHFSEQFNPDWKIRIGDFNWYGPLFQNNYYLNNSFHHENELSLHSFEIDSEYIKKNLDQNQFTLNTDGTINMRATLYFAPQSLFYVGLFVSSITMFIVIGIIIYTYGKSSSKKIRP